MAMETNTVKHLQSMTAVNDSSLSARAETLTEQETIQQKNQSNLGQKVKSNWYTTFFISHIKQMMIVFRDISQLHGCDMLSNSR